MRLRAAASPRPPRAPNSSTEPELGLVVPVMMRMSVDFPAPFSPMSP